jgi:hypothetical protein
VALVSTPVGLLTLLMMPEHRQASQIAYKSKLLLPCPSSFAAGATAWLGDLQEVAMDDVFTLAGLSRLKLFQARRGPFSKRRDAPAQTNDDARQVETQTETVSVGSEVAV